MTKKKWCVVAGVVVLVGVRLMLPELVKWKANAALATLPDYKGHIDRVHLALWRGAFALRDMNIEHKKGNFALTIKEVSTQISWRELLRRAVVADVRVVSPRVRLLVQKPAKAAGEAVEKTRDIKKDVEQKTGKSLPDLLSDLMPFQIRSFHLTDGTLRLQENGQDLAGDIEKDKDSPKKSEEGQEKERQAEARVTDLTIDVNNLTNAPQLAGTSHATGRITARVMEEGRVAMNLKLNPVDREPDFDVDLELTQINLVGLNPLFRWQWGVDVNKGTFAMFLEAHAKKGGFNGYVKPFIHDLDMLDSKDTHKSLGKKIKEAVVGAVASILENNQSENVASRVPFSGRFENPQLGIWEAVITILRNGFIQALAPHLDKPAK